MPQRTKKGGPVHFELCLAKTRTRFQWEFDVSIGGSLGGEPRLEKGCSAITDGHEDSAEPDAKDRQTPLLQFIFNYCRELFEAATQAARS